MEAIWLYPLGNLEVNTGEPTAPIETNFPANTTYSDIFTNNLLTVNAGDYDGATNTWIPNVNANGLSSFFLEIAQSGGTCKDTVRFDLETPVIETIYWVGGTNNWQTGSKWSTGNVPTASDLAGIYGDSDVVFIPVGTDAYTKYLDLWGKLTIRESASLNINAGASLRGIYVQKGILINNGKLNVGNCTIGIDLLNSTMTNNQDIICQNTNTCIEIDQNVGQTALLTNNGTISNNNGNLICGDDAEILNTGTLMVKFPIVFGVVSSNLTNSGIIEIEGNGSSGKGLSGTIVNEVGGSIFAEKLSKGVDIEGSNSGIIRAELCDVGVEITDNFINFSGAEIFIKNLETGMLVYDGNFENREGALVSIKRSGNYGLRIPQPFTSAGYLFNRGVIEIDTTAGIGILSSNDITNQGEINIVKSGGIGLNQEGGSINNENNGQITIDRSTLENIHIRDYIDSPFTYSSTFVNQANILIK